MTGEAAAPASRIVPISIIGIQKPVATAGMEQNRSKIPANTARTRKNTWIPPIFDKARLICRE